MPTGPDFSARGFGGLGLEAFGNPFASGGFGVSERHRYNGCSLLREPDSLVLWYFEFLSMPVWIVPAVGWLIFGTWCLYLLPLWPDLRNRWLRKRASSLPDPSEWPLLTVIVPARDEGAKVEPCLRSLLASDYPRLTIIAVDDRSRDETGAVMDRLAANDSRLSVIHVRKLPEGWLGKNHAMHVGAESAKDSEWLLFTDGDILYEPEALRLAVKYAVARQLDHLCLNPRFEPGGYWENVFQSYFGFLFLGAARPWLIPTAFKRAYIGIGAFNLMRGSTYRALGGHIRLRLDVMDDVHLGKLVKYSGYKQDLLFAGSLVRVRWQGSFVGVIRGLEKNGFASMGYSLPFLIFITLYVLLVVGTPYLAVALIHDWRVLPYVLCLLLTHGTFGAMSNAFGGGWSVAPMLPPGAFLLMFAFWRSAVITLRQGGVCWRDTFYPLKTLRESRLKV